MVQPDPASGPDSLPLPAAVAAIEAANVVLICCSERFKTEPRCRTESELVNQIRRPCIFLRMDFHMNFAGWISNLVGARDTVDMSGRRYNFEEGLKRLLRLMGVGGQISTTNTRISDPPRMLRRQMGKRTREPEQKQKTTGPDARVPRRSSRVLAMNREDVQTWLGNIGLGNYAERFEKYDGHMVDNLYVLHHSVSLLISFPSCFCL